ncbi:MAG: hypothetical protein HRT61_15360 [Ekhidna sp.]|nr:hypothetical protein [Ekhidna sp.]
MAVKASSFKGWCAENISPQSWTRICLRCTDIIRSKGLTLKEMEDLEPDVEMDDELVGELNSALSDLYNMTFDSSLVA